MLVATAFAATVGAALFNGLKASQCHIVLLCFQHAFVFELNPHDLIMRDALIRVSHKSATSVRGLAARDVLDVEHQVECQ